MFKTLFRLFPGVWYMCGAPQVQQVFCRVLKTLFRLFPGVRCVRVVCCRRTGGSQVVKCVFRVYALKLKHNCQNVALFFHYSRSSFILEAPILFLIIIHAHHRNE